MENQQSMQIKLPDPIELSDTLKDIAVTSERLASDFVQRRIDGDGPEINDDLGISRAFFDMTAKLLADPFRLAESQVNLCNEYVKLWHSTVMRMWGIQPTPSILPQKSDRRFRDDAWDDYLIFDFIKQFYLLQARWIQRTVADVSGLDERAQRKVTFYTRQAIDALAPTNFVLTNPEVLREFANTGGQSLLNGMRNLLEDLQRGNGTLDIRMTDLEAFTLGENIAVTPGQVVYQNDMMQLLQYEPSTKQVKKRPMLIVPPWINKFYILDLRAKNSFIKWLVDQGHTVFVISWVNPTAAYADKAFDDYLEDGTLAALDAIESATGEREVNAVGYCLGGTMLAGTLGYQAATKDPRVATATFLTTMLDFENPGELEVFLDDAQLTALEERMWQRGYLDGNEMSTTFNMLRANDLIWSFVVNNYLLGKDPFPFDLLYWNSDSTRMPANMHSFYLRNMYQRNLLKDPGGMKLGGHPIDLRSVDVPIYFLSTTEDHIAPWKSTYAGTQLFSGPIRFVLGASGHIAGVINPPAAGKYGYWTNSELPAEPEQWLSGATQCAGSWWNDWNDWLCGQGNELVEARIPGDGGLKALEQSPGSYVKLRIVN